MKTFFSRAVMLSLTIAALSACDAIIPPSINVDPNNPTSISAPSLLLTPVQVNIGYAIGGDGSRYAGIFSQYYSGLDRQFLTINDNYQLSEADVTTYWSNLYASGLNELILLADAARARNGANYVGASQLLRALILGNLTDVFGDIPSSQAAQGATNLRPQFDSQQQIYTQIQSLLDSALTNLAATSPLAMGADDQMYRGNIAQWRRAASLLKARYAIRLTKLNAMQAATQSLQFLRANPLTGNADDLQITFSAGAPNPMNQFQNQRAGNIDTNRAFTNLLRRLNDPRFPRLTLRTNNLLSWHVQTTAPVILASFAEAKFIEAEALARTGQSATDAYRDAVRASFTKLGLTAAEADTYLAQESVSIASTSGAETLTRIVTQKFIALFPSGEGYNEWRRTGVPALTPNSGQSAIPRRFPYPQEERFYNDANRVAALARQGVRDAGDLATPVWWDGGR
ncbi:MAG: SusD/RagB family nutrient-binding outer membrane lipoprotein [Candidatus Kapaibacterium sp.]|nr:MAG: SusD/RagB family nutrient-binding outer membrane lipoprotein [Candidatus Kapabacteria bacterium]